MEWLIDIEAFEKLRKHHKQMLVFDASWYGLGHFQEAYTVFLERHIPGALFFYQTLFCDTATILPNQLSRDLAHLQAAYTSLGITPAHKIVFYDHSPLHTSARALWILKMLGHSPHQLYLLDGGLPCYGKAGGPLQSGEAKAHLVKKSSLIHARFDEMITLSKMKENLQHPTAQVIDVRHPVRFMAGHIPDSFCFPYFAMFDSAGRFKKIEQIRKQLLGIGVDLARPIISTCGSGITATILDFVLDLMDHNEHGVYDGAWAEWGYPALYPGETSLDERPVQKTI